MTEQDSRKQRKLELLQEAYRRVHQLERELEDSEENPQTYLFRGRMRLMLENAEDIVTFLDENGTILYSNSPGRYGMTSEEARGKRLADLFPPEKAQELREQIERIFETGKADSQENEVEWMGERHVFLDHNIPIRDESGRVVEIARISRNITELRKTRESLAVSEQLYRSTIDSLNFALHVIDRNFELTLANRTCMQWMKLHDPSIGDAVGRNLFDICPFLTENVQAEYNRVFRTGETLITEESHSFDGRTTLTKTRKIPIFLNDEVIKIITTIEDVTEQRGLLSKVQDTEERYRLLFNNAQDEILFIDKWGRVLDVNERVRHMFGIEPEELIGTHISSLAKYTKLTLPALLKLFRQVFDPKKILRRLEMEVLTKDGTEKNAEVRVGLVRDGGKTVGILVNVRDITEQKKFEKQADLLHSRMESLIQAIPDVVYFKDAEGRNQIVNRAYEELTGSRREDIVGKTDAELLPPELAEQCRKSDEGIIQAGIPRRFDESMAGPDGETVYLESTKAPIFDETGRYIGLVGVSRNVTDRVLSEREKTGLEEQLHQSRKMEAIGRLAGGVAHDFNNLLTSITGNCSLMKLDLHPDEPLFESLNEIHQAADRAASLTTQLLAFGRKQILDPHRIDLNRVVTELETMLRRIIREDIRLEIRTDPHACIVLADPVQIEQILLNLVINSRDALPDGGTIEIETAPVTLDEDYCRSHTNLSPGPFIRLSVFDDGLGMDEDTLAHIFDPFYTTKPQGEGTGLGLATVYGTVTQHGGIIEAVSKPGRGTTFDIHLPALDEEPEHPSDPAARKSEGLPKGEGVILVVEDEAIVRRMTVKMLKRMGYAVLEAANGPEALEISRSHAGNIDVLLTDVIMPGMNGRDLAAQLAEIRPDTRVLFTSGYTADVIARHGVLESGTNFIGKPFTSKELASRLQAVRKEKT